MNYFSTSSMTENGFPLPSSVCSKGNERRLFHKRSSDEVLFAKRGSYRHAKPARIHTVGALSYNHRARIGNYLKVYQSGHRG